MVHFADEREKINGSPNTFLAVSFVCAIQANLCAKSCAFQVEAHQCIFVEDGQSHCASFPTCLLGATMQVERSRHFAIIGSLDHWISPSLNHWISLDHSITRSLNHWIAGSLDHSITRSLNNSMTGFCWITQSLDHSIAGLLDHSISQSPDHRIAQ